MWITDPSYEQSWVNLYYQTDPNDLMPWWWEPDGEDMGPPWFGNPSYVYAFESNEGYDTDNDNLGDRGELVDSSSPGSTDPVDAEDPIKRRALYLNGNAAARTRGGFYHDNNHHKRS